MVIILFYLFFSNTSKNNFNLTARGGEIANNVRKMPTSCEDLRRMGQKINGFFLVKGSRKMETVYCDFYSGIGTN
jgi:hypothetical protein